MDNLYNNLDSLTDSIKNYIDTPRYLRINSINITDYYDSTTETLNLCPNNESFPEVVIWDVETTNIISHINPYSTKKVPYGTKLTFVFTGANNKTAVGFRGISSAVGGQADTGAICGLTTDSTYYNWIYGTSILDFVFWNHGWYTKHY